MPNDDRNKRNASATKALRNALGLDKAAQQFLGFSDDTYTQIEEIKDQSSRFQAIINREKEIAHGVSGASIIDFVQNAIDDPNTRNVKLGSGTRNAGRPGMDIVSQLRMSAGDISGYFQDLYSNRYIEIADLMFLAKFIPALGAAVDAIVDAISQADDKGGTLNRLINWDSSVDEQTQKRAMEEIDHIEKDLDLLKKIKNIIIKNTVVSGEYYVYAIGYAELFEQYSKDRAQMAQRAPFSTVSPLKNGKRVTKKDQAQESEIPMADIFDPSSSVCMESAVPFEYPIEAITEQFKAENSDAGVNSDGNFDKALEAEIKAHASTFKIINSPVMEDIMPDLAAAMEAKEMAVNDPDYVGAYQKFFGSTNVANIPDNGAEAIRDLKDAGQAKAETGFDKVVNETYVRFVPSRRMIPIEIMDEVIGYYYISTSAKKNPGTLRSSGKFGPQTINQTATGVFSTVNLSDQRRAAVVDGIIQNMTEQIINKFGKKFVACNANFKQCIADVITYNGYMDNEYHVQFIPAKYVIPFKVNEDENGHGVSCLANSIFPAKLLLSLMVSKMLMHLNNGGDTRLIYVNKGPVDTHTGNHVQRTVRNLQEQTIVMSDLLSNNLLFNKYGRNKNIVIPNSRSGKRLVEFETQEGMQVDMRTDYEDKLEQMAVLGTGVPSVIMEYIGQADFAKAFENGNIKFATRIAGLAGDLEPAMTRFYQILLQNSRLSKEIKDKVVTHFTFNFGRSTSLTVNNNNELMGNIQTQIQTLQSVIYGDNSTDPNVEKMKLIFAQKYMRKMTTAFDWDLVDSIIEETKKEFDPNQAKQDEAAANGGGAGGVGGF